MLKYLSGEHARTHAHTATHDWNIYIYFERILCLSPLDLFWSQFILWIDSIRLSERVFSSFQWLCCCCCCLLLFTSIRSMVIHRTNTWHYHKRKICVDGWLIGKKRQSEGELVDRGIEGRHDDSKKIECVYIWKRRNLFVPTPWLPFLI